ncbi:MAG: LysM peptidoglycan-binding domain-containing protein [Anaerolineae bacterium]|nr:LysM peptidoglycan-binding domain-containing protein [Anaerolineae bacterium]
MRRASVIAVVLVLALLLGGTVYAQDGEIQHTVQPGENLYRIALRYGTTISALVERNGIVNPNLIIVGQVLIIPSGGGTVTATPDPGEEPVTSIHIVQAGENLYRIALRYGTTWTYLLSLNPSITNPNLIFVGQQIIVPGSGGTPVTPTPPPDDGDGPPNTAPNVGFAYGIQVHLPGQDVTTVTSQVTELEMTWVKQQIEWSVFEPTQGAIDWAGLDAIVDSLEGIGVNILLSVGKAPDWARDTTDEDGPPADFADYAAFVGALAERYQGRVAAYEVWNEQNLRREWNSPSHPISAAAYTELLRLAYNAIKTADPSAIVVSGGLAPTGFNDGVNAIDDRVYLRAMYANGAAHYADAIGSHPNGWANPPDSLCCNNTPGVITHDDHPSFFFLETLRDYRNIMIEYGDSNTFLWATEFGWGTNADTGNPPPAGYEFVTYTDLGEQASYTTRAFELGRDLTYVGPMFLWNLNFCQAAGAASEQCLWSLIGPSGARPVYASVRDMVKDTGE